MEEEKPLQPNVDAVSLEKPVHNPALRNLRTYEGDVEDAITKNKTSLVSIAAAEQKRKHSVNVLELPDHENVKQKIYVLLGSLLLMLGLVTIIAVYYIHNKNNGTQQQLIQNSLPLQYQNLFSVSTVNLTRQGLIQQIISQKTSFNGVVNSVLYIQPTIGTSTLAVQNFLELLAPRTPQALLRNISDTYMLGIYSFDTNEPFIILTTANYGTSYAGMLEWEQTMISDLGPIFNVSEPVGTSTPYVFSDESIQNKDLRIVKNQSGQTVMLYSFLDQNTILITTNEKIFSAILSKYITGKMIK